MKMTLIFCFPI